MTAPSPDATIHADVREYYGDVLQSSANLKTGACCPADAMPPMLRRMLGDIHPEILETFDMLAATRCAPHFELHGDKSRHFGLFDCAPASPTSAPKAAGACC